MTRCLRQATLPLFAVISCSLFGCSHNPPAYVPPPHTYKKDPVKAAQANMQLAVEYLRLNQLSNARDSIEKALNEDPANADVQMTAGLAYERIHELAKAEHAYEAANRLGRKNPNISNTYAAFLCGSGKTAAGEKLFLDVAANPLYQTPEVALVNAGVCARSSGDLADAEKYFNRALALRPGLPEGLLQLGNVEFDRGDAAQAIDIVQRYLAVNKPTPEILWLGFRAQRKLGDPVAAAMYARRVQAEFPTSEQAQSMRSGVDR